MSETRGRVFMLLTTGRLGFIGVLAGMVARGIYGAIEDRSLRFIQYDSGMIISGTGEPLNPSGS